MTAGSATINTHDTPMIVQSAKILWRPDDQGNCVPVSEQFGDIYYSATDGLAESRYVFLHHNHLSDRFTALFDRLNNTNNAVANTFPSHAAINSTIANNIATNANNVVANDIVVNNIATNANNVVANINNVAFVNDTSNAAVAKLLNHTDDNNGTNSANTDDSNRSLSLPLSLPTSHTFTIAELGFGTGLNVLVTWQLWQHLKETYAQDNRNDNSLEQARLHIISTEKFPLSHADLTRSLACWQQSTVDTDEDGALTPLIEQLLACYPPLVAGCHRLHLAKDVTLDLWLGDAATSLKQLYQPLDQPDNTPLDQPSKDINRPPTLRRSLRTESLPRVSGFVKKTGVDAWFLDGFAPSCNEDLWSKEIFLQLQRLSRVGSTLATYSSAGMVKRGLSAVGFVIQKAPGFGPKRQMLTAYVPEIAVDTHYSSSVDTHSSSTSHSTSIVNDNSVNNAGTNPDSTMNNSTMNNNASSTKDSLCTPSSHQSARGHQRLVPTRIAIVGAGVSGLMAAWALAQRGKHIILIDKSAPLAGASGNPRALLAPKMTPLPHVADHLHSVGYLYSGRLYRQLDDWQCQQTNANVMNISTSNSTFSSNSTFRSNSRPAYCDKIFTPTGTVDFLNKTNVSTCQITEYPPEMATVLNMPVAAQLAQTPPDTLPNQDYLYFPQAGLVNPRALADTVLSHPNIDFRQAHVTQFIEHPAVNDNVDYPPHTAQPLAIELLLGDDNIHVPNHASKPTTLAADAVIIAAAYHSHDLDTRIFDFRKIRGQLSWLALSESQYQHLPKVPLKYGGYCAMFTAQKGDDGSNNSASHAHTLLLGASFVRNDTDSVIRNSEHATNLEKLLQAMPALQSVLIPENETNEQKAASGKSCVEKLDDEAAVKPKDTAQQTSTDSSEKDRFLNWGARVGIRAQTPDYHPVVGAINDAGTIWTISGMGSKGFAFAPLCAEILADLILGQFVPIPDMLMRRLSPKRTRLQTALQ